MIMVGSISSNRGATPTTMATRTGRTAQPARGHGACKAYKGRWYDVSRPRRNRRLTRPSRGRKRRPSRHVACSGSREKEAHTTCREQNFWARYAAPRSTGNREGRCNGGSIHRHPQATTGADGDAVHEGFWMHRHLGGVPLEVAEGQLLGAHDPQIPADPEQRDVLHGAKFGRQNAHHGEGESLRVGRHFVSRHSMTQ